jgi:hypothetical protein
MQHPAHARTIGVSPRHRNAVSVEVGVDVSSTQRPGPGG